MDLIRIKVANKVVIMNQKIIKFYQYLRSIKYKYPQNPDEIFNSLLESQYWPIEKIKDYQLVTFNKLL